jgi:hypothetical protein
MLMSSKVENKYGRKMNEEEPLKEFIPKYEKPKILLVDLPEETLSCSVCWI